MQMKQRGTVLLSTLLIMSVVVLLTSSLMLQQRLDLHRTELLIDRAKTYQYALAVESWAVSVLAKYDQDIPASWPQILNLNEFAGGIAQGELSDAQARINLNGVLEKDRSSEFTKLLQTVEPNLDPDSAANMTKSLRLWVRAPRTTRANTRCRDDYAAFMPPYRCAAQPMISATELRLIKGMNQALFIKLLPYVIALPSKVKSNEHTASDIVLCALGKSPADIEKIKQQRLSSTPYTKIALSDYYLLKSHVQFHKQNIILYSLLKRLVTNNQAKVVVIWRSEGTL